MIKIKQKGNFNNMERFLKRSKDLDIRRILERFGQEGVNALAATTPIDTGLTAKSWTYEIVQNGSKSSIFWKNSNVVKGVSIAVILQYGHGTRNGGYVQGRDYINPAIRPIFDKIANNAWEEVCKL